MKRLFITGGTGFLGAEVVRQAVEAFPDMEIHATWLSQEPPHSPAFFHRLDLRDSVASISLLERIEPDCIIHTAATMGSDGLQPPVRPGLAEPLIVGGTATLARWCSHSAARFLHLSTDVVFSGNHAPYTERAKPSPMHRYGMAKYRAELEIRRLRAKAVIVRTSLIYGFAPMDVRTEALLDGTMTRFFGDEYRNPIWVVDLTNALLELAQLEFTGILHVAGPERLSRYEFARKTLHLLGIKREIERATIIESALIRAKDCTLDCSLAREVLTTKFHTIEEIISNRSI